MKNKEILPHNIVIPEGTELSRAPVKMAFCEQTYEYIIPIGENEFATLIIGEGALKELALQKARELHVDYEEVLSRKERGNP